MRTRHVAALAALLALAAMQVPSATAAPAEVQYDWFLTGETGDVDAAGVQGVQLMGPELAGTESQGTFSSIGSPVGVPVPGAPETVTRLDWYWNGAWQEEQVVVGDPVLVLYLQASVEVAADVRFELVAVGPDGESIVAADDRSVDVGGSAEPEEVRFALQARGQTLVDGSTLRLRVAIEGTSVATVLLYDSPSTPSILEGLRVQPLDSDGDGLPDSAERRLGSDPLDRRDPGDGLFDADGDGLSDDQEQRLGTDPHLADSDGDGWDDGTEHHGGTDPLDGGDQPADQDGDGVPDAVERRAGTRVDRADSDGDGVSDCDEDSDNDNLTNCLEARHGTDPGDPDSDNDGVLDGDEVARGTDPRLHPDNVFTDGPDSTELIVAGAMLVVGAALAVVGLARRHAL